MARKAAAKAETGHPMKNIVAAWLSKIELAIKVREEEFGQFAREAMNFFDGEHNWMWRDQYARGGGGFLDKDGGTLPTFRISVNKLFEAVAYFGPTMYAKNPNALVEAIMPPEIPPEALGVDPMDPYAMQEYALLAQQQAMQMVQKQACASVKTSYLNWLQRETDKKTESRKAITEALVAGVGYLETIMHQPPGSQMVMPKSRYVAWTDVVYDPDACYFEDVQWMAVRRVMPVNKVERTFGYQPGTLIGQHQSYASQPSMIAKKESRQNRSGKSFDLLEYWDVYSKNGFGDLLFEDAQIPTAHKFDYSVLGDYCYIACARSIPQPLNVPQMVLEGSDPQELMQRVQWPIPYWYDDNGWPVARLFYYDKPGSIWPISLFKPAIGELRFINWCLSFLADKVAASCQTYVGILKEAGTEIQRQIAGKSCPFTVIEIATALGKPLDQLVSFLQTPQFSLDIWNMIAQVLDLIDKRTGLTDLIYGMSTSQYRSAAEANVKQGNTQVRPDDMASKVEDFLSEVETREMQAARWFCEAKDFVGPCGQMGAMVWQNYVMTSDVEDIVRGYTYTIEAGSARRPNKAEKAEQLISLGQYVLPVMQEMALGGMVDPWNAFIADLAKNLDINPQPYLLAAPDPNQPSPEEQELQAEMQIKVAELELKMKEMQAKLDMEQQKLDMKLKHEKEMHELDMEAKEDEIEAEKKQADADLKNTKEMGKVNAETAKKVGDAKAKQAAKPKPKPKGKK